MYKKIAAQDLIKLIEEFYNVLPKFKTTPLYVFGIGYGGKIGVEFTRLLSNVKTYYYLSYIVKFREFV